MYLPAIVVLNKIDMAEEAQLKKAKNRVKPDICISAEKNEGIEELKELIYRKLKIIRIYLKEYNKKADMNEPLIMWQDCTLKDLCLKLHKDFVQNYFHTGLLFSFSGQIPFLFQVLLLFPLILSSCFPCLSCTSD